MSFHVSQELQGTVSLRSCCRSTSLHSAGCVGAGSPGTTRGSSTSNLESFQRPVSPTTCHKSLPLGPAAHPGAESPEPTLGLDAAPAESLPGPDSLQRSGSLGRIPHSAVPCPADCLGAKSSAMMLWSYAPRPENFQAALASRVLHNSAFLYSADCHSAESLGTTQGSETSRPSSRRRIKSLMAPRYPHVASVGEITGTRPWTNLASPDPSLPLRLLSGLPSPKFRERDCPLSLPRLPPNLQLRTFS